MGVVSSTVTVRTKRATTSSVLGLTDTLNLAIRLCATVIHLGDPLLKFESLRDNNVRGRDKLVSTS